MRRGKSEGPQPACRADERGLQVANTGTRGWQVLEDVQTAAAGRCIAPPRPGRPQAGKPRQPTEREVLRSEFTRQNSGARCQRRRSRAAQTAPGRRGPKSPAASPAQMRRGPEHAGHCSSENLFLKNSKFSSCAQASPAGFASTLPSQVGQSTNTLPAHLIPIIFILFVFVRNVSGGGRQHRENLPVSPQSHHFLDQFHLRPISKPMLDVGCIGNLL